jgi:hypothetical protein
VVEQTQHEHEACTHAHTHIPHFPSCCSLLYNAAACMRIQQMAPMGRLLLPPPSNLAASAQGQDQRVRIRVRGAKELHELGHRQNKRIELRCRLSRGVAVDGTHWILSICTGYVRCQQQFRRARFSAATPTSWHFFCNYAITTPLQALHTSLITSSPCGHPRQTLPSNRPANLGRLCQELRRGKRVKFALIWAPGSGRSTGSGRVEEAGKQSICLAYLRPTAAWPSVEPVPPGPLSASIAHGLGSPMHR